jgi:hypothetical protein
MPAKMLKAVNTASAYHVFQWTRWGAVPIGPAGSGITGAGAAASALSVIFR